MLAAIPKGNIVLQVSVKHNLFYYYISSTALFEEFSDWNTSPPHQTETETVTERDEMVNTSQPHQTETGTEREEMVAAEQFDCDPNITSVPESDGEEDEREKSEIVSVVADSSVLGTSEASDESLIGGCGQRRRNIARPDFLSTQAPPTFLSPLATTTSVSSDDEDFIEPLARRLKRKKREQRDGWLRKRESGVTRGDSKRACVTRGDSKGPCVTRGDSKGPCVTRGDSKGPCVTRGDSKRPCVTRGDSKRPCVTRGDSKRPCVTRGDGKITCLELNELIDREAELSGDEKEEVEEDCEEDCEDGYDMEDSFINDNSVLTQVQKP